jgi:uroporphyrinogen decarboxylase
MAFTPDYRHVVDAATNRKPARMPVYEHIIAPEIMARVLGIEMKCPGPGDDAATFREFYAKICRFWREMTYDTVSFEGTIVDILPNHGAILGGRPGPIQNRADFERYPFDELPELYWKQWEPHLEALAQVLPDGMKAVGGCGNGVFEISEDLVGYEYLCLLMFDDPQLFGELYVTIGNLMTRLWSRMLERYGHLFAVGRMGDDLGYKTSTLLAPETIVAHILPQYARIISLIHGAGKPFLLHCCGNIFSVMDDILKTGIDAKHSNEDQIAPFGRWIDLYNDRIGLFGGIDLNLLCTQDRKTVVEEVVHQGSGFRAKAKGYALGSGNSIPDYVPVDNYLAMIEAANELRRRER